MVTYGLVLHFLFSYTTNTEYWAAFLFFLFIFEFTYIRTEVQYSTNTVCTEILLMEILIHFLSSRPSRVPRACPGGVVLDSLHTCSDLGTTWTCQQIPKGAAGGGGAGIAEAARGRVCCMRKRKAQDMV